MLGIRIQRALVFLTVAMSIAVRAEAPPSKAVQQPPQRVLFVCEHGSAKSLIAMEYFNQRAKARGIPFLAMARGTAPAPVSDGVRAGLQADGFDVSGFRPSPLTASDVPGVSRVISFDRDIGAIVHGRTRYEQWDRLPAVSDDYGRGRDAIIRRVDTLLEELSQSARLPP